MNVIDGSLKMNKSIKLCNLPFAVSDFIGAIVIMLEKGDIFSARVLTQQVLNKTELSLEDVGSLVQEMVDLRSRR